MKKLLTVVVIGVLGWYAFTKYQSNSARYSEGIAQESTPPAVDSTEEAGKTSESFSCDGRNRCSQMNSCAEATYFVRNCPGVEMDGDGDGIPCERQWCGSGR